MAKKTANSKSDLHKKAITALKKVMDPELGINIVDLGLIYDLKINGKVLDVKMTLTFPGCPLSGYITSQVKDRLEALPGIEKVEINLIFEPPWTPDRVKKEIKDKLFPNL